MLTGTPFQLLLHLSATLAALFLSHFLHLPSLLLHSLFTYIHPDNASDGLKIALRSQSQSQPQPQPPPQTTKNRRSKSSSSSSSFDPSNSQLLRLRLSHPDLLSRPLFPSFSLSFSLFLASSSNILLFPHLPIPSSFALLVNFLSLLHLLHLLLPPPSETPLVSLSAFISLLVFLLLDSHFDFPHYPDSTSKITVTILGASLSSLLFLSARRSACTFWLGTDQMRWNLEVVSCGKVPRALLYFQFIVSSAAPLLWVTPVMDAVPTGIKEYRVWGLVLASVLHLLVLRSNVQMYLNEAVVCWYRQLHSGRVPDLDYGRAKVFLVNHYLCLAVLQFFAPPVMVLLLVGVSRIRGNLFLLDGVANWSDVVKEISLFLAWWIIFAWSIMTMLFISLYRLGLLVFS